MDWEESVDAKKRTADDTNKSVHLRFQAMLRRSRCGVRAPRFTNANAIQGAAKLIKMT